MAAPNPALSEPAPDVPGHVLPRIGADGRTPMAAYAAAFDAADPRPRVGLILAGVGPNQAASLAAIRALPAGITLAVSPYATHLDPLLAAARTAGHEYLVSIPMEPHGFPLNDPGDHALLTGQTPAQNRRALDWALSRFAGYVGATGALGLMRGERFAGSAEDMDPVLRQLASRGLLYVDPRPDAPHLPFAWGRDIDVVIDAPPSATAIDAALARLDRIAQRRGSALGLVGAVRPVTIAQLAAWAQRAGGTGARARPGHRPGPAAARRANRTQTAMSHDPLPYRANVGAVLFDRTGRVFLARRADLPNAEGTAGGWQLPQGGIDADENPRTAVLRELAEEIGTDRAEIIAEHPDWLTYDLPDALIGVALGGRYRGQRQRWFALRFTGTDADIHLDHDPHPEFDAWRWGHLAELPSLAVPFKQPIYEILARSFARFAGR